MDKIIMSVDNLDDGSAVINFDLYDNEQDMVVKTSGYVMSRQEDDHFVVTVFDAEGEVLSETLVPFNFIEL